MTKEECKTLNQRISKECQRLQMKVKSISKQLATLPEGKLYCTTYGKYTKWYVSDGKTSIYIPKKNRKYAEALAKKKYLLLQKEDYENEIRAMNFYLRHHRDEVGKAEQLLNDKPYQELLEAEFIPLSEELAVWQNKKYEQCEKYPEKRIHRTASGHLVRSKSESIIDMYLSINKIPFHYEEKLILGNRNYYPDFTIRHPSTGETIYWEHFGRMDDPKYVRKVTYKIQQYAQNGIIPGVNLITTYESKDHPLCTELVEKIIGYYF